MNAVILSVLVAACNSHSILLIDEVEVDENSTEPFTESHVSAVSTNSQKDRSLIQTPRIVCEANRTRWKNETYVDAPKAKRKSSVLLKKVQCIDRKTRIIISGIGVILSLTGSITAFIYLFKTEGH